MNSFLLWLGFMVGIAIFRVFSDKPKWPEFFSAAYFSGVVIGLEFYLYHTG